MLLSTKIIIKRVFPNPNPSLKWTNEWKIKIYEIGGEGGGWSRDFCLGLIAEIRIFSWILKHMSRRGSERKQWCFCFSRAILPCPEDCSHNFKPIYHMLCMWKKLHSLVLDQLVLFYYVLDFHAAKWPFSFPSTLGNQLRGRDILSSFPQVRGINFFGRVMNWMILFGLSGAVLSPSKLAVACCVDGETGFW